MQAIKCLASRIPTAPINRRTFATIPKHAPGAPVTLSVSDEITLTRSFSQSDVMIFTTLVGDSNPVHQPAKNATRPTSSTPLTSGSTSAPIVPGMLSASLFSTLFGSHLPGVLYVRQSLSFRLPIYMDETITAKIRVTAIHVGRKFVQCETTIVNQHGQIVVQGDATVLVPTLIEKSS